MQLFPFFSRDDGEHFIGCVLQLLVLFFEVCQIALVVEILRMFCDPVRDGPADGCSVLGQGKCAADVQPVGSRDVVNFLDSVVAGEQIECEGELLQLFVFAILLVIAGLFRVGEEGRDHCTDLFPALFCKIRMEVEEVVDLDRRHDRERGLFVGVEKEKLPEIGPGKLSGDHDETDLLQFVHVGEVCEFAGLDRLEFSAPENETDNIFIISTTAQKYPYAHIAQVTIDTQDGELVLPYNSAAGVEKIIRASNGDIKIYFGSLVPEFETGRIYWAQASYPETAFLDAPMDGNFYCRRNGQWVAVAVQALGSVTISGTQEYNENLTVGKTFSLTFDAIASNGSAVEIELTSGTLPAGLSLNGKTISGTPSAEGTASLVFTASADGATMRISVELTIAKQLIMYLGHVASTSEIYKVADITEAMLNAETVTGAPAGTLDKTSLGDASPGDMDFVLLPKEANLKALKFDGISGWLEFEENKGGVSGSGANGTEITLNGEQYLVYGEIRLIAGETFIKVEAV